MEKAIFLCILIFCLSSLASAQTRTKNELLQNTAGNQVTLGAPATVTNNTILLPGTLGLQGGLLYIGSVAGAVGSTTWLNPGTNGQVLTLSSGVPIWSTPTSAQTNFADNVFSIFNSTTNTKIAVFNAASISAATTRTFTFPDVNGTLITTGNLSSITTTGTVTSGIWNGTAIGPTFGGTGLATYILGDMLYANGANLLSKLSGNTSTVKQFLTQTGTGAISAQPLWGAIVPADINGAAWTLTGNSGTTYGTNFIGTKDSVNVQFRVDNIVSGMIEISGLFNTGLGYGSLSNATTGGANTAIGYKSLISNSYGADNTACGYGALVSNIGAIENTAMGYLTLFLNTAGSLNTACGAGTLYSNLGDSNTACGSLAGVSNTTGSNNTFLGLSADVLTGNLKNATAIGSRAAVNQSNSIVLGSINGVNGATASVNVGIGTTTPTQLLHLKNGHIRSEQTTKPTIVVTTQNGITAAAIANGSTDTRGTITTTGTNAIANTVLTITFNSSCSNAPVVMISPANASAQTATYFVTSTATTFVLNFLDQANATPSFNYFVIE